MVSHETTALDDAIRIDSLTKSYFSDAGLVPVLRGISTGFPRNRLTAVMGPSGSGKSTLLQCAAGLDRPSSGRVLLGDVDLATANARTISRIHREQIGFVFQSFNLLPMLSAADNVALPLRLAGRRVKKENINALLDQVGLAKLADRRPAALSGGQQQRVAIARALAVRPAVLFADEPTGSLDSASSRQVLAMLRATVEQFAQTVIMVTHDPQAAAWADSVIFLVDGQIVGTLENPTAEDVAARLGAWER